MIFQDSKKIIKQLMRYLRNRVAHEYFGIDYKIIWDIAKNYLPDNKALVDHIIEKYSL
jgi:uncharacterized protein with HEPN domain